MRISSSNRLMPVTAMWQRVLWALAWLLVTAAVTGIAAWGCQALLLHLPREHHIGPAFALAWGFAWLLLWGYAVLQKRLLPIFACGLLLWLALWMWWQTILPQAQRDWAPEDAHLAQVLPDKDLPDVVHLQYMRNFTWHSPTSFTAQWDERSYDLQQLQTVDVALSYWMGPAIAHTLVSFGFEDGRHVVFSVEIRKESHEQFNALAGFFKQYEMALVAADERDILAVRTNMRGERVHLYRVQMPASSMRALFLSYAHQAAQLAHAPRFYHTLLANCTTVVWQLARRLGRPLPLDWRLLASGYLPEYLRDTGTLASMHPLSILRTTGDITARAQSWQPPEGLNDEQASIDFSRHIRAGMVE